MYVCLCTAVNSETVARVVAAGARTSQEVSDACGAGSVCGRCRSTVRRIIAAELAALGERPPAALADEEDAADARRTRLVEVRCYAVRPADAEQFRQRVVGTGLPVLAELDVDVLHFGRSETSRHEADQADQAVDFVLIRSFSSHQALQRLTADQPASARWRDALGRAALDAVVEERHVAVLVPVDIVDGLRRAMATADFSTGAGTV